MTKFYKKRTESAYNNQKFRCENIKSKDFKSYGQKGIKVLYTKNELIEWVGNQNILPDRFVIGRIDHSKSYSLDNIKLETVSESIKEVHSRLPNPGKLKAKTVLIHCALTHRIVAECESTRIAAKRVGVNQIVVWNSCNGGETKDPQFYFRYRDFPYIPKKKLKVAKKIAIMTKNYSEILCIAKSAKEAAEFTEMTNKAVYDQCRALTKAHQSKFGFKYYEETL